MAIPSRTVQGKVRLGDGSAVSAGHIRIELVGGPTTVEDDVGVDHAVSLVAVTKISATGDVSFDLVPTDEMADTTVRYRFNYSAETPDRTEWTEVVGCTTSDPDPVDIGSLTRY